MSRAAVQAVRRDTGTQCFPRGAAGFEVGMSDSESTSLVGIAFWCVALAAFLLWALKHVDIRF